MKKNLLFALTLPIIFFAIAASGQNLLTNGDLELWDDANTPTGWDLMENISQEATNVHGGTYSAAQMSTTSSKKFRQDISGITAGQQYTISYYFLDNVDNAKTRIWSYWMDSEGDYLDDDQEFLRPDEYSENSEEWQQYNQVLTAPANATQFRFEVRVYHQDNTIDGHVYYDDFSFEGTSTNYPEPTNYPTDFEAMAEGLSISLNWADATGEQLPGAYLIYGIKGGAGSFPVPADGTPVSDDLDWNDNLVAVNVAYGEQTYMFNGLMGGENYEFTIYPYTNVGENIDYKTDGTPPLASASIGNLTVINEENFEDGTLGTWMQYNVEGPQEWEPYEFQGDKFVRISGYDGEPIVNEDWLISPLMNLDPHPDVKFEFINARNYDGPDVQLFLSQNYDGSGNPNDFTWVELTAEANWSTGEWEWVESGVVDLSLFIYPTCYLAFKYVSNGTDGAAAWEVDDLLVYSDGGVGISEPEIEVIRMYPNPASNDVSVHFKNEGEMNIHSISGQLVYSQTVQSGKTSIDISSFPKGLYLIHYIGNNASQQIGKLLVK